MLFLVFKMNSGRINMTVIVKSLNREGRDLFKSVISGCLDGECYTLAIVLSRGLGLPMVGLMQGDVIRHAVIRNPDGTFWDARGAVNEEELGKPFGISPPYDLKSITEEDLFAVKPITQITIDFILGAAQAIWPSLPWRVQSLKDKVISFASELEALSRKHGFWIYGSTPTMLPAIAQGQGDEVGYQLSTTIDGLTYMINRIIGD